MVDAATTSEAVGFITLMQELKRKLRSWEQQVEVSQRAQHIQMILVVLWSAFSMFRSLFQGIIYLGSLQFCDIYVDPL